VFNDLFIVCISIMIQRNFQNFNERISINIAVSIMIPKREFDYFIKFWKTFSQNKSKTFWNEHFVLYRNLCRHVHATSKLLGTSILLSFALNLYFICFNLLLNFK
jgi:hypothetical protein